MKLNSFSSSPNGQAYYFNITPTRMAEYKKKGTLDLTPDDWDDESITAIVTEDKLILGPSIRGMRALGQMQKDANFQAVTVFDSDEYDFFVGNENEEKARFGFTPGREYVPGGDYVLGTDAKNEMRDLYQGSDTYLKRITIDP